MRDVERVGFYRSSTWVDASDFDAKAAECERLRKAVHDLQLFVQDSRGLKIIADALSPAEGAGVALPEGVRSPTHGEP